MPEPPKPGEQIVVLYKEGDRPHGFMGGLLTVLPPAYDRDPSRVWFRVGGEPFSRALDEEGVLWARAPAGAPADPTWWDVLTALRAAAALAAGGEARE